MGEVQGALADAAGGERRRVEVLDDEDAVADVEDLRHLERPRGVLGRDRAVTPGVAAGEGHAALDEPSRGRAAGTRLGGQIRVGIVPVAAPAGVEEHGVARRRGHLGEVGRADHVARLERLDAADGRHVDQPSASDDLRHRFCSEPLDAGRVGDLRDGAAVVAAVSDLQVAERVDVRAELLRRADLLGDPVDAVVAEPALHVRVVGGGDERLAEEPAREHGHVLVQHPAEVVQPAFADQGERLAALRLVDVVEHAVLVVLAERRWPPAPTRGGDRRVLCAHSEDHGVEKLGNSVRPPSTKIVWPVM